jgi:hypothetical protein
MNTVGNIKTKGKEYTKKCIVHAVSMLYLIDIGDFETMLLFLENIQSETLFRLASLTNEMETALNLSTNAGINAFIYLIAGKQDKIQFSIDDDIFTEVQCMLGDSQEKMQVFEDGMKTKYGRRFKNAPKNSDDLNLYNGEKSVCAYIAGVLSDVTSHKRQNSEFLKSSGITFIDKYEFILQGMMDRSAHLKETLLQVNFLIDAVNLVFHIWSEYCGSNQINLTNLLNNSYNDIEKEITSFLK